MARYEFRYQQLTPDGRCFLDIPASADVITDVDCPFNAVSLNGATISGPLLEAVTDYMIEQGIVDAMRRLSGAAA